MCDISSNEVFLLVVWRGVTLVWFPFSFLLLSAWALFCFFVLLYSDCCLVLGGCFRQLSVSFGFFHRVGIEKALSYNIIKVLSIKGRFLLLAPGRVFFGEFCFSFDSCSFVLVC